MGFSLIGLAISVAFLAPNLILLVAPPRDAFPAVQVPPVISAFERIGQALCIGIPALAASATINWPWMLVVGLALVGYLALWVRYLLQDRRWALLYKPLGPIPVPMAVFPVLGFLAAAALLGSWWVFAAAVILGIGHIPVSLSTATQQ